MKKILIIEDDEDIANIQKDYLQVNGFYVHIELNGICGLNKALNEKFDLILLDIMLPGFDGFEICKNLRKKLDIPIFLVTAKLDDIDKIKGLGLGADDYIIKPFSPNELVARVKSGIAMYERIKGNNLNSKITIGDISINVKTRTVYIENKEIELKNKEYELLLFLMQNANIVFSKETLYEKIWGYDCFGDIATVAVHINRLRLKIEKNPSNSVYIQTIRGAGYKFKK